MVPDLTSMKTGACYITDMPPNIFYQMKQTLFSPTPLGAMFINL